MLLIRHGRGMFIGVEDDVRSILPLIVALKDFDLVDEVRPAELGLMLEEEVSSSETVCRSCEE